MVVGRMGIVVRATLLPAHLDPAHDRVLVEALHQQFLAPLLDQCHGPGIALQPPLLGQAREVGLQHIGIELRPEGFETAHLGPQHRGRGAVGAQELSQGVLSLAVPGQDSVQVVGLEMGNVRRSELDAPGHLAHERLSVEVRGRPADVRGVVADADDVAAGRFDFL